MKLAYTKIIALKRSLTRAVDYALNKDKTYLANAVQYALNPDKNESRIFESSVGCYKDTAYEDMLETKKQFNNTGGVVGYHIIQSFAPNEVTPEQAFAVAEEFVRRYLADKYEVIWSTHLDKLHYHNHIVFNSVSYIDGKKYISNAKTYYNGIRKHSADICREFGLSVITPDIENRSLTYIEWLGLKKGKITWQSIIRDDIDSAIKNSLSFGEFLVYIEHIGYQTKHGKYIAFRPYGKERFSRAYKLGQGYSEDEIRARISGKELDNIPINVTRLTTAQRPSHKKRYMTDMEKKYWRWMYQYNMVKQHKAPPKTSKYFKEEQLKFQQYKDQQSFFKTHNLNTESEFFDYIKGIEVTISKLKDSLREFQSVQKSNKALYTALADKAQYEKAYDLYHQGYTLMDEEANKYEEAVATLKSLGFATPEEINAVEAEKANVYDNISSIKKDIKHFQKELRICKNIEKAMEAMEKKLAQIENKKQLKNKERKK